MSISNLPQSALAINASTYFTTTPSDTATDPLIGIPRLFGRLYAREHLTSAIPDNEVSDA